MELEILLFNVTADLWIIVLLSFCIQTEERWSHKLHEFMTFQEAYLTRSAWTGPDGTLPVDQCVATLHSPLQMGVCVCLYVCVCVCVAFSFEYTDTGLFSPFPSLGSLSLWTRLGAGMAGQGAARPARCH